MSRVLEGLLLIDKPVGITSHDVVARVRSVIGERRVGHAGTLDPSASGLLPLAIGRATRLVRFLDLEPKVYTGELLLGVRTSTDDLDGAVVDRHEGQLPTRDEVVAAVGGLVGRMLQTPPSFSAKKVGGRRSYALARRGQAVHLEPVQVEVSRFHVRPGSTESRYVFEASVSAGTYVRGLIRDLGARLGCGATVAALRREAVGPLIVADAHPLSDPAGTDAERLRDGILPIATLPLRPPPVRLDGDLACARFLAGTPLPAAGDALEGTVSVWAPDGRLLGIAIRDSGLLRPCVVLGPAG